MAENGWELKMDNGTFGGYTGHLYGRENETAVVQVTSQAGQVTVVVVSGPSVSAPAEGALTSDFTPPKGAAAGPGEHGPWSMRPMSATSTDGLTFTRTNQVITDQGDVPDLVQDNKGWIYLYYVGWTGGTEQSKTVVAISQDGGSSWCTKK
ncbi:MAG: hypothetical protein ACK4GQ_02120 [Candidatus Hadarchaeales archaeon]